MLVKQIQHFLLPLLSPVLLHYHCESMQYTQHLVGLIIVTRLMSKEHLLKFIRQFTPFLLAIILQKQLQHMKESIDTLSLLLIAFQVIAPTFSRINQVLF